LLETAGSSGATCFHAWVPLSFVDDVFDVIAETSQHTYPTTSASASSRVLAVFLSVSTSCVWSRRGAERMLRYTGCASSVETN
jgi:protein gp37